MLLLSSSSCITAAAPKLAARRQQPLPPEQYYWLLCCLLNSDPISASAVFLLPVSGKCSAQYESLQEETNFKATRLQLWREEQEVSFSFLHRTAVGVAELTKLYQTWNSSTILPETFLTCLLVNTLLCTEKYTFMYWYVHKQQQHTDRTVLETLCSHSISSRHFRK